MPYADPNRSPYCAARHLLRQLGNAQELRRNPIVLKALGPELPDDTIVSAVQALVDRAFAAMDVASSTVKLRQRARHMAILWRCDVLRESRAAVASDLDLSLPQFERERRAAMSRFLDLFQNTHGVEVPHVQAIRFGLARTVCDRAMRLADSGDRRSALTLLENVVRTASTKEKVRALISISEIETADQSVNRSRAALESASALLHEGSSSADASSALWLSHEAASLRLRMLEHGPQAAAEMLRVRNELPKRPESVALLVAQAEVFDGCGMAKPCLPLVSRALALVPDMPGVDPMTRIDLGFLKSQMSFWLDPAATGRAGLEEAGSAARAGGYAGRALFAELSRLGGQWAATDDPRVRRNYRALLARIGRSNELSRQTRYFAYWDAADIECALGDPWRAADAARNALVLAPNSQRALLMKALLARAYARGGRFDMSARVAKEIIEHSDSSRAGTALFSAKRTLAYLASKFGHVRETWDHLNDAAELARRYGTARIAAEIDDTLSKFRKHRAPSVSIIFESRAIGV